jgi:hypothetical protein
MLSKLFLYFKKYLTILNYSTLKIAVTKRFFFFLKPAYFFYVLYIYVYNIVYYIYYIKVCGLEEDFTEDRASPWEICIRKK